jgi:hypothetical protein
MDRTGRRVPKKADFWMWKYWAIFPVRDIEHFTVPVAFESKTRYSWILYEFLTQTSRSYANFITKPAEATLSANERLDYHSVWRRNNLIWVSYFEPSSLQTKTDIMSHNAHTSILISWHIPYIANHRNLASSNPCYLYEQTTSKNKWNVFMA